MRDRMRSLRDIIIKYNKIIFPIIIVVAVAVTVAFALGSNNTKEDADEEEAEMIVPQSMEETEKEQEILEVPLERNEDGALYSLAATYYNALANGDVETIQGIKNYMEDTEVIRIRELSNYIESYPLIEIYTKPGPIENSYVVYMYTLVTFYGYEQQVPGLETTYVCTDEGGKLYMNEGETSEKVLNYLKTVNLQDDVVELNNRVNAQFNELMVNNGELFDYLSELDQQVSKVTGEILAEQVAGSLEDNNNQETEQAASQDSSQTGQVSDEPEVLFAKTTTTVNVRSSDSEQADKIGKVTGSTRVQVKEQRANGWSKIIFQGKEGYIKSEYLDIEDAVSNDQAATNADAVRTVTATTNVNMRKEANESAEKICVIVGGDSLELLSESNGWCQVRYNGVVGFVKAEYVR